jgi:ABC-type transport system involved in cytochrome c biogenesis permease subunit
MVDQGTGGPSSNIYTVLMLVVVITLAVGVGYVWYRTGELTGSFANPFQLPDDQASVQQVETTPHA